VPTFLTKGASKEDLQDDMKRSKIASELTDFLVKAASLEVNEDGYMLVDLEPQL